MWAAYSNELAHYGIIGQKWGIRRYQNPDGSLTEAGQKRYGKLTSKVDKAYQRSTRRQQKIVANEKGKYNEYKVKKAQLWIDSKKKLKDVQEEEIKTGLDYFENKLAKEQMLGQFIGGIPGQVIFAGLAVLDNKEEFSKREQIDKEYREGVKKLKAENKLKKEEQKLLKKMNSDDKSLTDFYKNRNYGKGVDELTEKGGLGIKLSKEQKEDYRSLAENEGRYSIDFLEAVQNSEMFYKHDTNKMLSEYDKFLDDPDKYWKEDSRKLKQV